jgi:hypothetical protein
MRLSFRVSRFTLNAGVGFICHPSFVIAYPWLIHLAPSPLGEGLGVRAKVSADVRKEVKEIGAII